MITALQLIVSVILIGLVLIQERSSGLSSVLGGGGTPYHTKRGAEKIVHSATIISAALFVILAILNLIF